MNFGPAHGTAKARSLPPLLVATVWMLVATLMWTTVGVSVRFLEGRVPVTDLSFFRAMLAVVIMLPLVWRHRGEVGITQVRRRSAALFGLRALTMFAGQGCFYFAVTYLTLAEATVLHATIPIFFAVLAVFVLRERVDGMRWLAIIVGFVGVAVILRPGASVIHPAALIGLASAFLMAWVSTFNKMLAGVEPASRIVFYTNILMTLIGAAVYAATGAAVPLLADVPLILAVALTGTLAQYCVARSLAMADASFVGPLDFVRVPMAALVGWIVFAELPVIWIWIGSVIVFASLVILTRGSIRRDRADSTQRAPPPIEPAA